MLSITRKLDPEKSITVLLGQFVQRDKPIYRKSEIMPDTEAESTRMPTPETDSVGQSEAEAKLDLHSYIVPEAMFGLRIDKAVTQLCEEYSRSTIQGWST